MAFKTVSDLNTDNAIALGGYNKKLKKENPTTITGYFIGSKEIDSAMSKTGKAKLHVFQTATGNVGVWGKTDLDRKLDLTPSGALTRVTFDGFQEIKGKNPMYKYKVEVDSDNTIEVAAPTTTFEAASDDQAYAYGSDDDGEDDVDAIPLPAARAPSNPARTPSADHQARVDALVAKRK